MENRFFSARERVLSESTEEGGIGTLAEKLVHKVLKYWIEPREEYHERRLCGSVADIFDGERIVEIQTRAFIKLLPKLRKFLVSYPVTVVYPVVTDRLVEWCDPESGEIVEVKKSPKKGRECDLLAELAGLSDLVGREGLRFKIGRAHV